MKLLLCIALISLTGCGNEPSPVPPLNAATPTVQPTPTATPNTNYPSCPGHYGPCTGQWSGQ